MVLNAHENIAKGEFEKSNLISNTKNNINSKKYIEAKWIKKYSIKRVKYTRMGYR